MILFCLLTSVMGADCVRAQEKASEKNMEVPKVYMFTKISAENLVKIYEALGREATGKVAVKLSTGEPGGHNFLQPALIKDLVKKVNGTIVECNTAYGGGRADTENHLKAAKEHGFTAIAPVDIMDADGEVALPVKGGKHLKEDFVGSHYLNYDFTIILSHFKGHAMGGFGGAIKNIGMGCGSRAGKKEQHTNGQPTIHEDMCRGCRRCMRECANNGLVFDEETKKMHIDGANCVGCGRCIGACNFDAIEFENWAATKDLNCRMAEYTKAVVDGRPNFHISLVVDVSPNCDCHAENDAPILPNIGMFASFDPLALDQACVDACLKMQPLPNSQLSENMHKEGFCDHHDHFENSTPESEYKTCLEHAEKIGLGSREYELIVMK